MNGQKHATISDGCGPKGKETRQQDHRSGIREATQISDMHVTDIRLFDGPGALLHTPTEIQCILVHIDMQGKHGAKNRLTPLIPKPVGRPVGAVSGFRREPVVRRPCVPLPPAGPLTSRA